MTFMNYLRNVLGLEPLVLTGSGTDEEIAKKVCIEKYRGWDICYYYGKMYRYYDVSTEFSSIDMIAAGQYTRSEWIGNGVYIGAFNDSYYNGAYPLGGVWIRISIERIDMKFENSPEKVKLKFDREVLRLKETIDSHIRMIEVEKTQKAERDRNRKTFGQAIDQTLQEKRA